MKSETSGNFELALLTILRCAENPAKYFAKVSHSAIFRKKIYKHYGTIDSLERQIHQIVHRIFLLHILLFYPHEVWQTAVYF